MQRIISFERLPGNPTYRYAWERQVTQRRAVEQGEAPNTVFVLEHAPLITLGRKADPAHVLASPDMLARMGITLVPADRGGDVTYHGPGQMVAYPILDLNQWRCSVGWYLRSLEQVLIHLLADFGLSAERLEGFTGVWVGGAKVAAIGVGVHQWVTFHGLALNVDPNPEHWASIIPCGIVDKPTTSLSRLLGEAPPMKLVMDSFEKHFRAYFEPWTEEIESASSHSGDG